MDDEIRRFIKKFAIGVGIFYALIFWAKATDTEPNPQPLLGPLQTRCADGTWSRSEGQGTCSWHGGIANP